MRKAWSLTKRVRGLEEWAERNNSVVAGFVEESERLAITYTGLGIVPARIFSSYLYVLSPNKNIISGCIDTVTYHIAPYTEDTRVILFAEKGVENSVIRLVDTVYYTGNKLLIISPPPAEYIRKRLKNTILIEAPGEDTILAETLLAVRAGYSVALKYKGREDRELRFNRLRIEVADFSSIIDELKTIYSIELDTIKTSIEHIDLITYTPTMEPVAHRLQALIASKTGNPPPIVDITRALRLLEDLKIKTMLLFSTSVEEYSVRELLFRSRAKRIEVIELKIKTDPLTAPVYGLLLVEILKANNI